MLNNWYAQPEEASHALQGTLGRCVPETEPLHEPLRHLLVHLCLLPRHLTMLQASGLGLAALREALGRIEAYAARHGGPERVVVRALAEVAGTAPQLEALLPSPCLEHTVGHALVDALVFELYPPEAEATAPEASARRAASELLAFHALSPDTLATLGPHARAELASRLESRRKLLQLLTPPAQLPALGLLLETACPILRGQTFTDAPAEGHEPPLGARAHQVPAQRSGARDDGPREARG